MKILFTNVQLDHRTGTEIVVRDLAIALRRRRHEVAVYTPNPGGIADELRDAGIPVVDRIEATPFVPDVLHGHHHVPTLTALAHFSDLVGVWVCHDRFGYQDLPPRHPRIGRYVAVDLNCRERFVEVGVPADRVSLVHNAVDLDRYTPRAALPAAATRAAVFSNNARPGGYVDAIDAACRRMGITLDVIGEGFGTTAHAPETLLPHYDVVFAKARSALEALAVGCAVILVDHAGLGPMVTMSNVAMLRDWNFGDRCLQARPTEDRLLRLIQGYDAEDARRVSHWIRSVAGLDGAVGAYLALYDQASIEPLLHGTLEPDPLQSILEYAGNLERHVRSLEVPVAMLPLPPTIGGEVELRVSDAVRTVSAGSTFGVDATVSNHSRETLASLPPYPVHMAYHWVDVDDPTSRIDEGLRTSLPHAVHPGSSATIRMVVQAPRLPGAYVLRVSPVQESVFWFDELVPPVAKWLTVQVTETRVGGTQSSAMSLTGLARLHTAWQAGDIDVVRDGAFANLGFARDEGPALLTWATSQRFLDDALANPAVTCVITSHDLEPKVPEHIGVIAAVDPKHTFYSVHNWLARETSFYTDDRLTTLHGSARVHRSATIAEFGVSISEDCVIGPNVVITGPVRLGPGTHVDAGAVIGASGFQVSTARGNYVQLDHAGGVTIGRGCHIHSNATIASGVFRGHTRIGDRSQIGANAFVSHDCHVGSNVFIGHGATVNGRVAISDDVWVGPGVTISNGLHIGTGAHVALGSVVMQDIAGGARVSGLPAIEQQRAFRHATQLKRSRR